MGAGGGRELNLALSALLHVKEELKHILSDFRPTTHLSPKMMGAHSALPVVPGRVLIPFGVP